MSDPSRVPGRGLVCWALGLVALHTGVVTLHAAAHLAIPVLVASPLDGALILGAFYAGPALGALCLYAGRGPAPTILAGSFLVGLAYGVTSRQHRLGRQRGLEPRVHDYLGRPLGT